ncbi:glycosyltransferase family 2 protein [bacterium]|nr:glycosyltransferase family 2 protein [bacterium]
MRENIQLSVVLPAYNEEKRLSKTLETVTAYLRQRQDKSEIIVVSDGSTDQTVAIAKSFNQNQLPIRVLHNKKNRGKGAAVRRGVAAALGEWVLFSDADMSTPIEEIVKLEKVMMDGADVVIASRALTGSDISDHQPFYREWMGKTFNLLVQSIVLPGFQDTQCGFKMFKRDIARKVFRALTIPGFGFDVEILYLAKRAGAGIQEVPVSWHNVLDSKVSPLRHSIQMFLDLFRVRWRHRKKNAFCSGRITYL